ncbi:MAG: hypothetical protein MOGMAGMI_01778 [Candidatus Omnitrophica bacterium]|nr:hypothetical protein [Candidatus Omnitrophota bacterium]
MATLSPEQLTAFINDLAEHTALTADQARALLSAREKLAGIADTTSAEYAQQQTAIADVQAARQKADSDAKREQELSQKVQAVRQKNPKLEPAIAAMEESGIDLENREKITNFLSTLSAAETDQFLANWQKTSAAIGEEGVNKATATDTAFQDAANPIFAQRQVRKDINAARERIRTNAKAAADAGLLDAAKVSSANERLKAAGLESDLDVVGRMATLSPEQLTAFINDLAEHTALTADQARALLSARESLSELPGQTELADMLSRAQESRQVLLQRKTDGGTVSDDELGSATSQVERLSGDLVVVERALLEIRVVQQERRTRDSDERQEAEFRADVARMRAEADFREESRSSSLDADGANVETRMGRSAGTGDLITIVTRSTDEGVISSSETRVSGSVTRRTTFEYEDGKAVSKTVVETSETGTVTTSNYEGPDASLLQGRTVVSQDKVLLRTERYTYDAEGHMTGQFVIDNAAKTMTQADWNYEDGQLVSETRRVDSSEVEGQVLSRSKIDYKKGRPAGSETLDYVNKTFTRTSTSVVSASGETLQGVEVTGQLDSEGNPGQVTTRKQYTLQTSDGANYRQFTEITTSETGEKTIVSTRAVLRVDGTFGELERTETSYDARGRQVSQKVLEPFSASVDTPGVSWRERSVTDSSGTTTSYTYDASGTVRSTTVKRSDGAVTEITVSTDATTSERVELAVTTSRDGRTIERSESRSKDGITLRTVSRTVSGKVVSERTERLAEGSAIILSERSVAADGSVTTVRTTETPDTGSAVTVRQTRDGAGRIIGSDETVRQGPRIVSRTTFEYEDGKAVSKTVVETSETGTVTTSNYEGPDASLLQGRTVVSQDKVLLRTERYTYDAEGHMTGQFVIDNAAKTMTQADWNYEDGQLVSETRRVDSSEVEGQVLSRSKIDYKKGRPAGSETLDYVNKTFTRTSTSVVSASGETLQGVEVTGQLDSEGNPGQVTTRKQYTLQTSDGANYRQFTEITTSETGEKTIVSTRAVLRVDGTFGELERTETSYDARGRQVSQKVLEPFSASVDTPGVSWRERSVTDSSGTTTSYTYDASGTVRSTTVKTSDGKITVVQAAAPIVKTGATDRSADTDARKDALPVDTAVPVDDARLSSLSSEVILKADAARQASSRKSWEESYRSLGEAAASLDESVRLSSDANDLRLRKSREAYLRARRAVLIDVDAEFRALLDAGDRAAARRFVEESATALGRSEWRSRRLAEIDALEVTDRTTSDLSTSDVDTSVRTKLRDLTTAVSNVERALETGDLQEAQKLLDQADLSAAEVGRSLRGTSDAVFAGIALRRTQRLQEEIWARADARVLDALARGELDAAERAANDASLELGRSDWKQRMLDVIATARLRLSRTGLDGSVAGVDGSRLTGPVFDEIRDAQVRQVVRRRTGDVLRDKWLARLRGQEQGIAASFLAGRLSGAGVADRVRWQGLGELDEAGAIRVRSEVATALAASSSAGDLRNEDSDTLVRFKSASFPGGLVAKNVKGNVMVVSESVLSRARISAEEYFALLGLSVQIEGSNLAGLRSADPLKQPYVVLDLEGSQHLFEDHLKNGLIGVNMTALTAGRTGTLSESAKVVFMMGLMHELYHEASPIERQNVDRVVFEAERLSMDVEFAFVLADSMGVDTVELEAETARLLPGSVFYEAVQDLARPETLSTPAAEVAEVGVDPSSDSGSTVSRSSGASSAPSDVVAPQAPTRAGPTIRTSWFGRAFGWISGLFGGRRASRTHPKEIAFRQRIKQKEALQSVDKPIYNRYRAAHTYLRMLDIRDDRAVVNAAFEAAEQLAGAADRDAAMIALSELRRRLETLGKGARTGGAWNKDALETLMGVADSALEGLYDTDLPTFQRAMAEVRSKLEGDSLSYDSELKSLETVLYGAKPDTVAQALGIELEKSIAGQIEAYLSVSRGLDLGQPEHRGIEQDLRARRQRILSILEKKGATGKSFIDFAVEKGFLPANPAQIEIVKEKNFDMLLEFFSNLRSRDSQGFLRHLQQYDRGFADPRDPGSDEAYNRQVAERALQNWKGSEGSRVALLRKMLSAVPGADITEISGLGLRELESRFRELRSIEIMRDKLLALPGWDESRVRSLDTRQLKDALRSLTADEKDIVSKVSGTWRRSSILNAMALALQSEYVGELEAATSTSTEAREQRIAKALAMTQLLYEVSTPNALFFNQELMLLTLLSGENAGVGTAGGKTVTNYLYHNIARVAYGKLYRGTLMVENSDAVMNYVGQRDIQSMQEISTFKLKQAPKREDPDQKTKLIEELESSDGVLIMENMTRVFAYLDGQVQAREGNDELRRALNVHFVTLDEFHIFLTSRDSGIIARDTRAGDVETTRKISEIVERVVDRSLTNIQSSHAGVAFKHKIKFIRSLEDKKDIDTLLANDKTGKYIIYDLNSYDVRLSQALEADLLKGLEASSGDVKSTIRGLLAANEEQYAVAYDEQTKRDAIVPWDIFNGPKKSSNFQDLAYQTAIALKTKNYNILEATELVRRSETSMQSALAASVRIEGATVVGDSGTLQGLEATAKAQVGNKTQNISVSVLDHRFGGLLGSRSLKVDGRKKGAITTSVDTLIASVKDSLQGDRYRPGRSTGLAVSTKDQAAITRFRSMFEGQKIKTYDTDGREREVELEVVVMDGKLSDDEFKAISDEPFGKDGKKIRLIIMTERAWTGRDFGVKDGPNGTKMGIDLHVYNAHKISEMNLVQLIGRAGRSGAEPKTIRSFHVDASDLARSLLDLTNEQVSKNFRERLSQRYREDPQAIGRLLDHLNKFESRSETVQALSKASGTDAERLLRELEADGLDVQAMTRLNVRYLDYAHVVSEGGRFMVQDNAWSELVIGRFKNLSVNGFQLTGWSERLSRIPFLFTIGGRMAKKRVDQKLDKLFQRGSPFADLSYRADGKYSTPEGFIGDTLRTSLKQRREALQDIFALKRDDESWWEVVSSGRIFGRALAYVSALPYALSVTAEISAIRKLESRYTEDGIRSETAALKIGSLQGGDSQASYYNLSEKMAVTQSIEEFVRTSLSIAQRDIMVSTGTNDGFKGEVRNAVMTVRASGEPMKRVTIDRISVNGDSVSLAAKSLPELIEPGKSYALSRAPDGTINIYASNANNRESVQFVATLPPTAEVLKVFSGSGASVLFGQASREKGDDGKWHIQFRAPGNVTTATSVNGLMGSFLVSEHEGLEIARAALGLDGLTGNETLDSLAQAVTDAGVTVSAKGVARALGLDPSSVSGAEALLDVARSAGLSVAAAEKRLLKSFGLSAEVLPGSIPLSGTMTFNELAVVVSRKRGAAVSGHDLLMEVKEAMARIREVLYGDPQNVEYTRLNDAQIELLRRLGPETLHRMLGNADKLAQRMDIGELILALRLVPPGAGTSQVRRSLEGIVSQATADYVSGRAGRIEQLRSDVRSIMRVSESQRAIGKVIEAELHQLESRPTPDDPKEIAKLKQQIAQRRDRLAALSVNLETYAAARLIDRPTPQETVDLPMPVPDPVAQWRYLVAAGILHDDEETREIALSLKPSDMPSVIDPADSWKGWFRPFEFTNKWAASGAERVKTGLLSRVWRATTGAGSDRPASAAYSRLTKVLGSLKSPGLKQRYERAKAIRTSARRRAKDVRNLQGLQDAVGQASRELVQNKQLPASADRDPEMQRRIERAVLAEIDVRLANEDAMALIRDTAARLQATAASQVEVTTEEIDREVVRAAQARALDATPAPADERGEAEKTVRSRKAQELTQQHLGLRQLYDLGLAARALTALGAIELDATILAREGALLFRAQNGRQPASAAEQMAATGLARGAASNRKMSGLTDFERILRSHGLTHERDHALLLALTGHLPSSATRDLLGSMTDQEKTQWNRDEKDPLTTWDYLGGRLKQRSDLLRSYDPAAHRRLKIDRLAALGLEGIDVPGALATASMPADDAARLIAGDSARYGDPGTEAHEQAVGRHLLTYELSRKPAPGGDGSMAAKVRLRIAGGLAALASTPGADTTVLLRASEEQLLKALRSGPQGDLLRIVRADLARTYVGLAGAASSGHRAAAYLEKALDTTDDAADRSLLSARIAAHYDALAAAETDGILRQAYILRRNHHAGDARTDRAEEDRQALTELEAAGRDAVAATYPLVRGNRVADAMALLVPAAAILQDIGLGRLFDRQSGGVLAPVAERLARVYEQYHGPVLPVADGYTESDQSRSLGALFYDLHRTSVRSRRDGHEAERMKHFKAVVKGLTLGPQFFFERGLEGIHGLVEPETTDATLPTARRAQPRRNNSARFTQLQGSIFDMMRRQRDEVDRDRARKNPAAIPLSNLITDEVLRKNAYGFAANVDQGSMTLDEVSVSVLEEMQRTGELLANAITPNDPQYAVRERTARQEVRKLFEEAAGRLGSDAVPPAVANTPILYVQREAVRRYAGLSTAKAIYLEGSGVILVPVDASGKPSSDLTEGLIAHELIHAAAADFAHHDVREGLVVYFAAEIADRLGDTAGASDQRTIYARARGTVDKLLASGRSREDLLDALMSGSFSGTGVIGIREAVESLEAGGIDHVLIEGERVSVSELKKRFGTFRSNDKNTEPILIELREDASGVHLAPPFAGERLDLRLRAMVPGRGDYERDRARELISRVVPWYFENRREGRATYQMERSVLDAAFAISPEVGSQIAGILALKESTEQASGEEVVKHVMRLNNGYLNTLDLQVNAEFDSEDNQLFLNGFHISERRRKTLKLQNGDSREVDALLLTDLDILDNRSRESAINRTQESHVSVFRNKSLDWASKSLHPYSAAQHEDLLEVLLTGRTVTLSGAAPTSGKMPGVVLEGVSKARSARLKIGSSITDVVSGQVVHINGTAYSVKVGKDQVRLRASSDLERIREGQTGEMFMLDAYGQLQFVDLDAVLDRYPQAAAYLQQLNRRVWQSPIHVGLSRYDSPVLVGADKRLRKAILDKTVLRATQLLKEASQKRRILRKDGSKISGEMSAMDLELEVLESALIVHELRHKKDDLNEWRYKDQTDREMPAHMDSVHNPDKDSDLQGAEMFAIFQMLGYAEEGNTGLGYKRVSADTLSYVTSGWRRLGLSLTNGVKALAPRLKGWGAQAALFGVGSGVSYGLYAAAGVVAGLLSVPVWVPMSVVIGAPIAAVAGTLYLAGTAEKGLMASDDASLDRVREKLARMSRQQVIDLVKRRSEIFEADQAKQRGSAAQEDKLRPIPIETGPPMGRPGRPAGGPPPDDEEDTVSGARLALTSTQAALYQQVKLNGSLFSQHRHLGITNKDLLDWVDQIVAAVDPSLDWIDDESRRSDERALLVLSVFNALKKGNFAKLDEYRTELLAESARTARLTAQARQEHLDEVYAALPSTVYENYQMHVENRRQEAPRTEQAMRTFLDSRASEAERRQSLESLARTLRATADPDVASWVNARSSYLVSFAETAGEIDSLRAVLSLVRAAVLDDPASTVASGHVRTLAEISLRVREDEARYVISDAYADLLSAYLQFSITGVGARSMAPARADLIRQLSDYAVRHWGVYSTAGPRLSIVMRKLLSNISRSSTDEALQDLLQIQRFSQEAPQVLLVALDLIADRRKDVLKAVLATPSLPFTLRINALGRLASDPREALESYTDEAFMEQARVYLRDFGTMRIDQGPQLQQRTKQALFHLDLRTIALASYLRISRIIAAYPDTSGVKAELRSGLMHSMRLKLYYGYDNANSDLEVGREFLKRVNERELVLVIGHEWGHVVLHGNGVGSSGIEAGSIHEFIAESLAFALAEDIGWLPKVTSDILKLSTYHSRYPENKNEVHHVGFAQLHELEQHRWFDASNRYKALTQAALTTARRLFGAGESRFRVFVRETLRAFALEEGTRSADVIRALTPEPPAPPSTTTVEILREQDFAPYFRGAGARLAETVSAVTLVAVGGTDTERLTAILEQLTRLSTDSGVRYVAAPRGESGLDEVFRQASVPDGGVLQVYVQAPAPDVPVEEAARQLIGSVRSLQEERASEAIRQTYDLLAGARDEDLPGLIEAARAAAAERLFEPVDIDLWLGGSLPAARVVRTTTGEVADELQAVIGRPEPAQPFSESDLDRWGPAGRLLGALPPRLLSRLSDLEARKIAETLRQEDQRLAAELSRLIDLTSTRADLSVKAIPLEALLLKDGTPDPRLSRLMSATRFDRLREQIVLYHPSTTEGRALAERARTAWAVDPASAWLVDRFVEIGTGDVAAELAEQPRTAGRPLTVLFQDAAYGTVRSGLETPSPNKYVAVPSPSDPRMAYTDLSPVQKLLLTFVAETRQERLLAAGRIDHYGPEMRSLLDRATAQGWARFMALPLKLMQILSEAYQTLRTVGVSA